ncbi:hypothetical protein [Flavimarina sp. Hel_I_48]|uniref:hypothetical protein n=1 Tax=Flavimarina sp. Hel_I_48 TaxID=1392488 RepID=UPI0004DF250B|nr:hypothetical protein [Flavimarina sp. Hel_I_48]
MPIIDLKTIENLLNSGNLQLIATQEKLSLPILQRLCAKMKAGVKFDEIHIKDNRIVDGHHRYVSAALTNITLGTAEWKIARSAIDYPWEEVIIETMDWDTTAEVEHFKATDVKK